MVKMVFFFFTMSAQGKNGIMQGMSGIQAIIYRCEVSKTGYREAVRARKPIIISKVM